jgi:protein-S-isoprenylcysteine O-methyltransferase Ste14
MVMASPITPLALCFAFMAVTVARSYWLWRTAGVNPYVIDHHDPLHRFVAGIFYFVGGGLLAYFIALAVAPEVEAWSGVIPWAAADATRWSGAVLMAAAIAWTGYAQFAMGSSWRIGIPTEAPPLRTDGPFALSRNPIFLGMLLFVAGAALRSPSAVTLVLLAATYISLEVQIRSEEAFLERVHGAAYHAYMTRVRRWI